MCFWKGTFQSSHMYLGHNFQKGLLQLAFESIRQYISLSSPQLFFFLSWGFFHACCSICITPITTCTSYATFQGSLNTLNPIISINIPHTLPCAFSLVMTRRICLTIKACQVRNHFLQSNDLDKGSSSITVTRNQMLDSIPWIPTHQISLLSHA